MSVRVIANEIPPPSHILDDGPEYKAIRVYSEKWVECRRLEGASEGFVFLGGQADLQRGDRLRVLSDAADAVT